MNYRITDIIQSAIEKGEQVSPFLFICPNTSALLLDLQSSITQLQEIYGLPSSYILRLEDTGENLKVSQTRILIEKSAIRPDYRLQIFAIENISRLTIGASNSLLKVLEEPGVGNIIFLTNTSQSGVLDTILSRVQPIVLTTEKKEGFTQYIEELIESYISNNDSEIVSYYFTKQVEKQDAFDFLYALIKYIKKTGKFSGLLVDVNKDINGLGNNNFLPKYVIDKYIILLKK